MMIFYVMIYVGTEKEVKYVELKKYIGAKIKELRVSKDLSQEQVAELLGTTKQTVSRYEKGDRGTDQDLLFKLSSVFGVSIDYFFPPLNDDVVADAKEGYDVSEFHEYNYIPAEISAGLPDHIEAVTDAEQIKIPDSLMGKWAGDNSIYITRVNGESMNRIIPHNSLIAIKPVSLENLKNGDIVVYNYDNEYAVKRFYDHGDKIVLRPDSDDMSFTDQIIPKESDIDLKIKGKVVLYIVELD